MWLGSWSQLIGESCATTGVDGAKETYRRKQMEPLAAVVVVVVVVVVEVESRLEQ